MATISDLGKALDAVNEIVYTPGVGSGLGSATAGFDPELKRYAPFEFTNRAYSILFIFPPKIFEYLFRTYSPLNAEIMSVFKKYQQTFLFSADSGAISVETDEIGGSRPNIKYKYPVRVMPSSMLNTTLVDAYQLFNCLYGSNYSCLIGDLMSATQRAGKYVESIRKASGFASKMVDALGLSDKGVNSSIIRPIIEGWIDWFDKIVYDDAKKGLSFMRQRALTKPDWMSGVGDAEQIANNMSKDEIEELLVIRRMMENNSISRYLIDNPGAAYKGVILYVRFTPDLRPKVVSSYAFIGAFPTQINLLDFSFRDSDLELLNISWSYDLMLAGEKINDLSQTLMHELYENFKPVDNIITDLGGQIAKTVLENLPVIGDFAKTTFEPESSDICLEDLGAGVSDLEEALKLSEQGGLTSVFKSPRSLRRGVSKLGALTGNAAKTLKSLRRL